jgi:hypothetical protein
VKDIRAGQGAVKAWVEKEKVKQEVKISGLYNIMMLVCIYMAQVGVAQMHFALMLQLMADVNAYPDDGPKYNNPRYFWACMFAISEVLLRRLIQDIKFTSRYSFSIIMDSSTDVSAEDHVMIFISYTNKNFETKVVYLATVHVVSKTAQDIYNVLMSVLTALDLDKQRMVGFCSDGGSEYSGKHNGVTAKLLRELPWVLVTHCAAHRCALAMNDVEKTTTEQDGTYGMRLVIN